FNNVSLNAAGTGYTLQATTGSKTAPVITAAVVGPFNVVPGAVTQLAFTAPPPSTLAAGAPLSFAVAAEDANGNIVTNYNTPISLALSPNPDAGVSSLISGIASISVTGVISIAVGSGGSGYSPSSPPVITISAPTGANPVQATATAVVTGNAVT